MSGFVLPITWRACTVRPDVMQIAVLGRVEIGRVHVSGRSVSWASRFTKHQMIWTSARGEAVAKKAVERQALEFVLSAGLRPAGNAEVSP